MNRKSKNRNEGDESIGFNPSEILQTGKVRFHFDNLCFDDPLCYGPYRVMQVGDLAVEQYQCEEHIQRVHEISLAVTGRATFYCNREALSIARGDIAYNPNRSLHEIQSSGDEPFRYYYIGFEITDRENPYNQKLSEFFDRVPPFTAKADPAVADAFVDIFNNLLHKDAYSELMIEDAVRKLLVAVRRSYDGGPRKLYSPELQPEKNRLLSSICSYLDSCTENIDAIGTLTGRFGYSYSHLSAIFSKAMNISLREYFMLRRHERECELLRQGYSVTTVAEKMGYSSVHSFTRAFTAHCGMTPTAYKSTQIELGTMEKLEKEPETTE